MSHQISQSESLLTVPKRKVIEALEQTVRDCNVCSIDKNVRLDRNLCEKCSILNKAIQRYAESNIPVKYWPLEMTKHFKGDSILMDKYKEITSDLRKSYRDGIAFCFAGSHGLGKTLVCCNVLKRAAEQNYSCLYVNLSDIISVMLSKDSEESSGARRQLLLTDFLVIDEFDPRYMSNDKTSDLFGKILEQIFRTRSQNSLPILMCTNSPNVTESFVGPIKQSITSLMSCVKMVPVLGKDFRIANGVK